MREATRTMMRATRSLASRRWRSSVNVSSMPTLRYAPRWPMSITTTLDRYGHLMPGNEEAAAGLLDAYLTREEAVRA